MFPFRSTFDSFGKTHKLLAEHLQCIKNILDDGQHKCRFDKENAINRDVNEVKLIPKKSFKSLFTLQKIVPVILEEDEINR